MNIAVLNISEAVLIQFVFGCTINYQSHTRVHKISQSYLPKLETIGLVFIISFIGKLQF